MMKEASVSPTEIASLAMLAKDAYDQKRTRESLFLSKRILQIDPENTEALALQAAIRTDLDREFHDALAMVVDARSKEDGAGHHNGAEIALSKILNLDPTHEQAKALLNEMREASKPAPPTPQPEPESEIPFTAAYKATQKKVEPRPPSRIPFVLVAGVIIAAGIFVLRPVRSTSTARAASSAPPTGTVSHPVSPTSPSAPTYGFPSAAAAPSVGTVSGKPGVNSSSAPSFAAITTTQVARPVVNPVLVPAATVAPGTLAVSSPTPADIYMDDKYLGSTPTTLELPPGSHTLEYRHDNLRTVATHVVKPNETTTALITFDTTVQINAKPWAQVFIDGPQRQALGQTPLSDVRVPIGKVLVFENPKFPAKTYRVTGKDAAIQVVFP